MKNKIALLVLFLVGIMACKHEPIQPDAEYLDQAAQSKVSEYSNGYLPSSHGVISINFKKDSMGKDQFNCGYHINNNNLLFDSFKVDKSHWVKLPNHFGGDVLSSSLSSDKDQLVSFQIRSKTPKDEYTIGEVIVPHQTPLTASDLGNNTFKITWEVQRKQRILLSLYTEYTYTQPYYTGNYAVETDDDGEFIFKPEVFEKFGKNNTPFNTQGQFENMKVSLYRNNPKRKIIITQASTGAQIDVFGGYADGTYIMVLKK
jgi:hypothetical protein